MPRISKDSAAADKTIATRIRDLRIGLGITAAQLAIKIEVSHQQMRKYELGQNRMSPGRLLMIADALGRPVQYFYDGLEDPEIVGEFTRLCMENSKNFVKIKSHKQQAALSVLTKTLADAF